MFTEVIKNLEDIYNELNEIVFEGGLPKACITVQHAIKKKSKKGNYITLGWFNCAGSWEDSQGDEVFEITITPDSFKGNYMDIIGTLVHEMVHVYCHVNKIEDCKGKKHTEDFKAIAENVGLVVEKDKQVGYGITSLSLDLIEELKELDINENCFKIKYNPIIQDVIEKPKKPKTYYKCPCCEEVIKSRKKDLKLICGKCNQEFKYIVEAVEE